MGPELVGQEDAGADPMGDDQEREIGRRVVGALMAQVLATDLAGVDDLEIRAEQLAPAAGRASAEEPAGDRRAQRTLGPGRGNAPEARHVVHRRLSLRIALNGAGPVDFRPPLGSAPARRISNLSAPANGAASTRRTLMGPPRRNASLVRVPMSARVASSKR